VIGVFKALKAGLTLAPVLQLSNFTKVFMVDYDIYSFGVGAILYQGKGSLAFFNRAMAPHTKLSAYEREEHWGYL
jgi:hypothetical protein